MQTPSGIHAQEASPVLAEGYVSLSDVAERAVADGTGSLAFRETLAAFQRRHGPVAEAHFCRSLPAACVLTQDGRVHLTFPPQTAAPEWIGELLLRAHQLHIEVRQVLRPPDSRICIEMLFALIRQLLHLLDHLNREAARIVVPRHFYAAAPSGEAGGEQSAPAAHEASYAEPPWHPEAGSPLHRQYERQLAEQRAFYERAAQRAALSAYFTGMAGGTLALLVLTALTAEVLWLSGWVLGYAEYVQLNLQLMVLVVGGIGAIVSVMQRMTRGDLVLQHHAGRPLLRLVGGFRPLIGAVFASVVTLLLQAGLVPVSAPAATDGAQPFLFYAVVAFFAGFSERWAQDMLAVGPGSLAGARRDEHSGTAQVPAEDSVARR